MERVFQLGEHRVRHLASTVEIDGQPRRIDRKAMGVLVKKGVAFRGAHEVPPAALAQVLA